jgi:hypothetical protein
MHTIALPGEGAGRTAGVLESCEATRPVIRSAIDNKPKIAIEKNWVICFNIAHLLSEFATSSQKQGPVRFGDHRKSEIRTTAAT